VARFSTLLDACVLAADIEALEKAINPPDDNDPHAGASASLGRADVIVTNNLRVFQHVLRAQAEATTRPKLTTKQLLQRLAKVGAPKLVEAVSRVF